PTDANTLRISAKTGQGLTQLRAKLEEVVTERLGMTEVAPLTRQRHREAVEEAAGCIGQALQALSDGIELASEDLRMASRALGRLRGHIDVERILDQIFAKFCIGK
ncbi:MAG: tRNA uridine-5-carboxymethylaminomethyl(34) synthesis GTPase MnmE, partial [Hyphomonadaceae bacterium]|nr:tRNA uridine-5-carboxymethylaminomethyl(34) synthesis GTPase MnmE [Hyphomonadaceae bacterium]